MPIISVTLNTSDLESINAAISFINSLSAVSAPSNGGGGADMDLMGGSSGNEDMLLGSDDNGADDMLGDLDMGTPSAPTKEDLAKAYAAFVNAKGKDTANKVTKQLLAKVGAANLAAVAEEKRANFIAAIETLTNR